MDVSTVFKRSYLRRQYRAAVAASTTLILQLESEQDTIVSKAERGQTIAGTSAKGHSVNYSVPGNGAPTQGEMTEVIEELITLYYQVDAISGVDPDSVSESSTTSNRVEISEAITMGKLPRSV